MWIALGILSGMLQNNPRRLDGGKEIHYIPNKKTVFNNCLKIMGKIVLKIMGKIVFR